MNAGRTLDPRSLDKMIEMVATLHESWVAAAKTQAPSAVAGAVSVTIGADSLYEARQF